MKAGKSSVPNPNPQKKLRKAPQRAAATTVMYDTITRK